jgi:exosortase
MRVSRRALATSAIVALAWIALYGWSVPSLVRDWRTNEDFSHGFLVPGVAIALVLSRREALAKAPSAPSPKGAWLLGAAILVHLLGAVASELYLQRSSMVPFLLGWIWLLEGPTRMRTLLFPIGFLLFMIPPPNLLWSAISLPLQLLASRAAEVTLHLAGVPVLREGNVIHLEHHSLEVASACSGIRSLVTLLALATILADGTLGGSGGPRTWAARSFLVFLAVPVAVVVNALRVSSAALVATVAGSETIDRFHDLSGFATFALAFALLAGGKEVLRWVEERPVSRSALS